MYVYNNLLNAIRIFYLLIAVLFLSACSKSFVVVGEIPTPLIDRSALTAKVKYTDEFKNYTYVDPSNKRALENVEFGSAQVVLFDRIFASIFNQVSRNEKSADIIIEPSILEFQYSDPAETKSTQYEVWLKYRILVTDNTGIEIADWVVKGYGKTPKSLILTSHLKLFNKASNIALRDVGAQLAIGFRRQSSIEDFINKLTKPSKYQDQTQSEIKNQQKEISKHINGDTE